MNIKTYAFGLLVLTGVGCSSFRPDAGFDEVGRIAQDRVGGQAVWLTGSAEDEKVRDRLREMLPQPLSEDDVVQIVLLNNLDLQATYQELGIAQADVVQAGLITNPTLGLERRFPNRAAEVDVAQSFLDVFLVPLRQRVAGANFEAAKLRVAEDVVKHAFDARLAYVALQADMQQVELWQAVAAATEASAESARKLREAGNLRRIDVQKEELLAAQAKLELATADGEVAQVRERLNRSMGLWGNDTGWTIPGRLRELPADDAVPGNLEPMAIESRLDLASARRELEGLGESVGIARITAVIPDITLTGHFEREPEGDSTSGPSLTLPLPIFNWGRAASGQARARFIQAQQRYAALAIEIRSEVRAAYASMGLARAKAAYYRRQVLPLHEEAVRQTQLLYNGMFVGVFDLLETKREQIDAAKEYIDALKEYWAARTELEAALGRKLPLPATPLATLSPVTGAEPAAMSHHHGH